MKEHLCCAECKKVSICAMRCEDVEDGMNIEDVKNCSEYWED